MSDDNPAPVPSAPEDSPSDNERMMAMLCHRLAIFTHFIGPLVIWLVERDKSRFVDRYGREVLNFVFSVLCVQIALVLLLVCGGITAGALAGKGGLVPLLMCLVYLPMLALGIYALVMLIVGAIEANRGGFRDYPYKFEFIRDRASG